MQARASILGFLVATWLLGMAAPVAAVTVKKGNANLAVSCGGTTSLSTDWYFPEPNASLGMVWLQHGFARANDNMADIANKIAELGYVVFAPSMGSIGTCTINNTALLDPFAALFADANNPGAGLLQSARSAASAAGTTLSALPTHLVFSGHSAGGGAVTYVAARLASNHPSIYANLKGLALLDPVESNSGSLIASSLPSLTAKPIRTVSSPPYSCNSNASGTDLLIALPRPFVGVRLTSGSHCDAEGESTNTLCTLTCGNPQAANISALQTLTKNWINDYFADSFTVDDYPGGSYYEAQKASSRIVTLPETSSCGNGTLNGGEQCDDGNTSNADCCTSICSLMPANTECRAAGGACDIAETCNGSSATCPADLKSTATCRATAGVCDVAEACNGTDNDCPADSFQGTNTVCRAAAGECDLAERCSGSAAACPIDSFVPNGSACSADGSQCTLDICDGATADCQHPAGNTGALCRASAGECDVVELCDGSNPLCPNDAFVVNGTGCTDDGNVCTVDRCNGVSALCQHPAGNGGTQCRAAAGVCDVAETCDGSSAVCPANAFLPTTTVCRSAMDECDAAESCSGSAAACPTDGRKSNGTACGDDGNPCTTDACDGSSVVCQHAPGNAGAVCRASAGACDVAETCSGSSSTCPADVFAPLNSVCRAAAGECDVQEVCSGVSVLCPADVFRPLGTACTDDGSICTVDRCSGAGAACQHIAGNGGSVCRAAAGVCDVAETCSGTNTACPADAFLPASTACRPAAGSCDLAENCSGTGAACPLDAKSTAICRAANGPCDVAESCDGSANTCPADSFVAVGSVCRAAAGVCDLAETCSGGSGVCPTDVKKVGVCRAASGACDVAEFCDSVGNDCPADAKADNGTACDDGDSCTAPDSCGAGVCAAGPVVGVCGDGDVCGSEACDDGNAINGDGCDANCTATGCGNGILTVGEVCDDGNLSGGDGCRASCTLELIPGNRAGTARSNPKACLLELSVANPTNLPPTDKNGRPNYVQICRDNDPTCDFDPTPGGRTCEFHVIACLNNNDPNLTSCPRLGVASPVIVTAPSAVRDPINYGAFIAALQNLRDPASGSTGLTTPVSAAASDLCSAPFVIRVPLRGITTPRKGKVFLRTRASSLDTTTTDRDSVTLVCTP